jgi:hypothetical protein
VIIFLFLVAVIGLAILGATNGSDSRFDRPGRQL